MHQKDELWDRCRREIEELHEFFEGWLSGRLPKTEEAFERVEKVLASDSRLIHPSGEFRTREEILSGLRQAHGSQPSLTIEIREPMLLRSAEETALAIYEEWQTSEDGTDGRISTVQFGRDENLPNGLQWQHVHETWLQEPESR
jgi:hypothetical protein